MQNKTEPTWRRSQKKQNTESRRQKAKPEPRRIPFKTLYLWRHEDKCPSKDLFSEQIQSATKKEIVVEAKSVIWATGWEPYDAKKLDILGFGKYPDVITNVMMERLAATDGPTQGKILRPSTKQEVKSVAFVQCAGSRDNDHLEYCSSICCMASLKQSQYIREQHPEADFFQSFL